MSTTRRRRSRVVLLLVVVAAAVAAAAYVLAPHFTGNTAADNATTGSGSGAVAAGEDGTATSTSAPYTIKPEPTEVARDSPVPSSTDGSVQVALTYVGFDDSAGTVQANGFVAGVIEDGGTCTLTLTRGSDEVTARSTASADATTTTCGLLETGTGLAAGSWKAVLAYTSDDADGTSQTSEVTVR